MRRLFLLLLCFPLLLSRAQAGEPTHDPLPGIARAYLVEIDPLYCDVIVERWEKFTGQKAERISNLVHSSSGGAV